MYRRRKDNKKRAIIGHLEKSMVLGYPGLTKSQLRGVISFPDEALRELVEEGVVIIKKGQGNTNIYYIK